MVDYNPFDEDQQQAGQQPGATQAVPQVIGGATGVPTGETVTGTGSGGQSQQRGSGRFTNIQKYLKANEGSNIGQQLGEEVKKEAASPLANIGTARDQVQQKLSAEQQRLGQGASNILNKVQNYQGKTPLSREQYDANPQDLRPKTPGMFQTQQFVPSSYEDYLASVGPQIGDEDINAFQKLYNAQAEAPSIDNLADLQAGAEKVQGLADQSGTEQGRFGLLKQFFGRPTYSTGQQRLDQLLLQTQPQEAKGLAQAASTINKDTQGQLAALKSMQETGISEIAQQAAARQAEAKDLLGQEAVGYDKQGTGLLGGLVDSIEQRTKQANDQKAAEQALLLDIFSKSKVGQGDEAGAKALETLRRLGFNESDSVYLPEGTSAQTFINPAQQAGLQAFTSPEERARYLMLQKLAGSQQPGLFTGEEQLGGFNKDDFFNRDAFNNIQRSTKESATASLSPLEAQKRAIESENYDEYLRQREGQLAGSYQNWNNYRMERLANVQKQLDAAKAPYGGTTIGELIARYSGLPLNTITQNANAGKIGLF